MVGQGTAAVAGQALAVGLARCATETDLRVEALPATELSGFGLRSSMADTLVVAISQSGTTTDTNRTVDLVRSRGARVVSIVNRRGSDLTDAPTGCSTRPTVATSRCRSRRPRPSTARSPPACCWPRPSPTRWAATSTRRSSGRCACCPTAMAEVLERRPTIAEAAHRLAPAKRYWAVVGNGVNRIAAAEVRIKLSELCYKSIASDATEDKKHIDLSSEPLIVVCAAGLTGSTGDDVAKEVAIYRAHKASPIVIATDGQSRFALGAARHPGPRDPPRPGLRPVGDGRARVRLRGGAGHRRAGPAAARGAGGHRAARVAGHRAARPVAPGPTTRWCCPTTATRCCAVSAPTSNRRRAATSTACASAAYDGQLEASTAVRLAALLRYVLGVVPLDAYQLDQGKVGTPAVVIDDLTARPHQAIEELTRPVDAIKHQAKTVTVGISRSDETLLEVPLVREVIATGAHRDQLTYRTLRTLADISPAIEAVVGAPATASRARSTPRARPRSRSSTAAASPATCASRTDRSPELRGTKARVAASASCSSPAAVATGVRS